ncbi:hypothetical protein CVT26_005373 [Gymnopilus dilepis]|uniref:Uncharacterized protein n=1 Tax=Gymnopilus dilepis TaxID=231916 RepID=A0A409YT15_9AGAR|nr:hypothetical protein CVT26_005373 [Gymnopilus dilepis]
MLRAADRVRVNFGGFLKTPEEERNVAATREPTIWRWLNKIEMAFFSFQAECEFDPDNPADIIINDD